VRPTEDPEKVKLALTNLFTGEIHFEGQEHDYGRAWLTGHGHECLENFKMILQRDRIRAAARSMLLRGVSNHSIIVYVNKQVAYVGHVSFSAPQGESPLGPIRVQIDASDPLEIINWLTGSIRVQARE
jgi:predicted RNA binding protein with dsRBD fold (UPF0201 family)